MKNNFFNDQLFIAERFNIEEEHVSQAAQLAFFKINSYKLSLVHAAFCRSRKDLREAIEYSLLNYVSPSQVLVEQSFFDSEIDN